MDSSVSVYGEAKGEYTKQLCVFLVVPLQRFFLDLLEIAKQEEPDKRKHLMKFQDLLKQIPDWNVDKVSRETAKIQEQTGCDYLEELLTAVFIAHTKVLSAIRLSSKNKSIQITVPKLEHFLHRTMTESARRIWSTVYLFADNASSLEKQKNLRQLEVILQECIQQAIRGLLPVKNLLRDYLSEPDNAQEEDEEPVVGAAGGGVVAEPVPEEVVAKPLEPVVAEPVSAEPVVAEPTPAEPVSAEPAKEEKPAPEPPSAPTTVEQEVQPEPPTIVVDTEPRVHFSDFNTVFNPSNPNNSELVKHEHRDEDDVVEDFDELRIYDEIQNLSTSDFESLDKPEVTPIEFEEL